MWPKAKVNCCNFHIQAERNSNLRRMDFYTSQLAAGTALSRDLDFKTKLNHTPLPLGMGYDLKKNESLFNQVNKKQCHIFQLMKPIQFVTPVKPCGWDFLSYPRIHLFLTRFKKSFIFSSHQLSETTFFLRTLETPIMQHPLLFCWSWRDRLANITFQWIVICENTFPDQNANKPR